MGVGKAGTDAVVPVSADISSSSAPARRGAGGGVRLSSGAEVVSGEETDAAAFFLARGERARAGEEAAVVSASGECEDAAFLGRGMGGKSIDCRCVE